MTSPMDRLRTISVKTPCRVSWDGMTGDDTVRHCGSCRSSVYNLSAMTDEEREALLAKAEDVCIRYYSRPDGTLVRTNCSDKAKRAPSAAAAGVAMTLAASTAFVGIDAAVDTPEVTTVDGERVLVAMGLRLTIKPRNARRVRLPVVDAEPKSDVVSDERRLGLSVAPVCPDPWGCAPDTGAISGRTYPGATVATTAIISRTSHWRHAWLGVVGLLAALLAFVTRRRWWFGEPG